MTVNHREVSTFQKVPLRIKKLPNFKGELPFYQTPGSSGFDVRAQLDGSHLIIGPGERALISTGLSFEIMPGYELQSRPRSGLAIRNGLGILNSPGTIDSDYRGEVKIIVVNLSGQNIQINDGERIAQMILAPVVQAEFLLVHDLNDSERGVGGFGSTGIN